MRYVVFGAGAIGGVIGGLLALSGREVTLIARGPHLEAIRRSGLLLRTPDGQHQLPLRAVASPAEVEFSSDSVVIVATKTQDTAAALDALATVAPGVAVVCAQNGVENERLALRRFDTVFGMCVVLPATHLEAGVVVADSGPVSGVLEMGRVPSGDDSLARVVADDLSNSGLDTIAVDRVMPWKYAKLLANLGNVLDAASGDGHGSGLLSRARDEARACLVAAGIGWTADSDMERRRSRLSPVRSDGRGGSSSWQSLRRRTGSIETDYLNGEIVLLGRLHGVPTPMNAALQQLGRRLVSERIPAGSMDAAQLERELTAASR